MKTYKFQKIITGTALLLLLMFVLTSCSQQQPGLPKEVSILWSEIDQDVGLDVGDILEVVLPVNQSAGDIWEVGFYNQSVLKPYGEAEFSGSRTNLGSAESQLLHFEAIGEGETELVLVFREHLENQGAGQQIFKVYIVVTLAVE